ncbi:unnamed protein product [Phytophthora fragariaefolia]|uniref:Unnamed protein product n=1 Tax=Phytophthora fragariaefolia TaxID=1490495 RepID=A0A9W6YCV9_9STRA|nr:unnamed protein product [Phytophthora fragariaefolia]
MDRSSLVRIHLLQRRGRGRVGREDVKLERSPGWNPVRAERSRFCIYAYVEKQSKAVVNKVIDNTCDLEKESATAIANLHQTDEYSRSEVKMILDIASGESRGYWKYHVPDKKFKQAKAVGKINNAKPTLLFDSGAEVSILHLCHFKVVLVQFNLAKYNDGNSNVIFKFLVSSQSGTSKVQTDYDWMRRPRAHGPAIENDWRASRTRAPALRVLSLCNSPRLAHA